MAFHDNNSALRLNLKSNTKEPYIESKIPSPSFKLALNNEGKLQSPRKYNVSTLRIPPDPSWPKIPQRRFADNMGDIIDQPYVVTVTGTPRRSRTIVRTPNSQIIKGTTSKETVDSTFYGCNSIPTSQPLRRRPGCIDPRFKRVTTVKSQMKSTEPQEHEHETPTETSRSAHIIPNQNKSTTEKVEHSIPEKDTNAQQVTQQEAEKPNEAKRAEIGIQAFDQEEEHSKLIEMQTDFNTSENCKKQQNEKNEKEMVKSLNYSDVYEMSQNKNCNLRSCRNTNTAKSNLECCQETPEGKISNKLNPCQSQKFTEMLSNDNQCKLTKKDLSPQKFKCPTFQFSDVSKEIFHEKVEFEKENKTSEDTIKSQCSCKERENFQRRQVSPEHEITLYKSAGRLKTFIKPTSKKSESLMLSEASMSLSEDDIYRNRCKEHIMDYKESFVAATSDSEYCENEKTSILKRKRKLIDYYNSTGEESNYSAKDYEPIDFFQTHDGFYNFDQKINSSENEEKSEKKKKEKEIENAKFAQKMKSEQNLSHEVFQKRLSPNSGPLVTMKERRCTTSYSKNTSDYTQEKSEMTDSEFAFLCPERQRTRLKTSYGYSQKLIEERRNRSCDSEKRNNSGRIQIEKNHFDSNKNNRVCVPHPTDLDESKRTSCKKLYQIPPQHLNSSVVDIKKNENNLQINSPRADTDIATEKPTRIPIRTQKLLSKSYWEYYRKLKQENKEEEEEEEEEDPQKQYFCQVAMGTPQIKKKKEDVKNYEDQSELSPPELRTLERCSVLSCMINKTLDTGVQQSTDTMYTKQLFMNANMKSSSDPTAETPSAAINQLQSGSPLDKFEGSSISSKSRDKRKNIQMDDRFITFKAIVIFGILLYLIVVFLPMMYDYFFYEEYDEYANLTYIELALDYVVSSFREAFEGVFDLIYTILFRPFLMVFSANVGSVTALLKFILSIVLSFR